jgi:hypothetical protein
MGILFLMRDLNAGYWCQGKLCSIVNMSLPSTQIIRSGQGKTRWNKKLLGIFPELTPR